MVIEKPTPGQDAGTWGEKLNTYLDALTPGPGEIITGGTNAPERVSGTIVASSVNDGIGEWWTHPLATYQDRPYPRTVFGAIAANGDICACEFNHGSGKTRRYPVWRARPDDHNAPALWFASGHRPVIAWTQHSYDSLIRMKVGSRSGDLGSFLTAPVQTLPQPAGVSYTQLFRIEHLSDATQDTFWCFTRLVSGTTWNIQPFSVNQASGEVTPGERIGLVNHGSGYLMATDGHDDAGQVIRVAWGQNPGTGSTHALRYIEIDAETGSITSPVDGTFTANLDGTNLPLEPGDLAPFVPAPPTAHSRRLYYPRPGPDEPAIAYADWPQSTPENAVYKVAEWEPGYTSLQVEGTGRAATNSSAAMNDANGFTYTVALRLPDAAPTTTCDLGSKFTGSDGWYFRILGGAGAGQLRVYVQTTDGTILHASPGVTAWGEVVGFRLVVDVANNVLRRYWSMNPLDAEPTWTQSGGGVALNGTVVHAPAPLSVPGTVAPSGSFAPEVYWVEMRDSAGAVVAAVDFRHDWTPGAPTYTDVAGNTWSLTNTASVVASPGSPRVREYGIAGPAVGYFVSNYNAGMCFENPSYDGAVILARTDDGTDTVEKWRGTEMEVLHSQPTEQGRLIRPYSPVNGGPLAAIVSDVQSYAPDNYTEYESNMRAVSR